MPASPILSTCKGICIVYWAVAALGKKMEKKELLYEGKAKKVYTTENEDALIVSYKDDATAFNGQKKGQIVGKGIVNNRMTNHIFKMLESKGIPTHYI